MSATSEILDAVCCQLCGRVMSDPVVVLTNTNPLLVQGQSYERVALEQFLANNRDSETRFGPNTALKSLIRTMNGV